MRQAGLLAPLGPSLYFASRQPNNCVVKPYIQSFGCRGRSSDNEREGAIDVAKDGVGSAGGAEQGSCQIRKTSSAMASDRRDGASADGCRNELSQPLISGEHGANGSTNPGVGISGHGEQELNVHICPATVARRHQGGTSLEDVIPLSPGEKGAFAHDHFSSRAPWLRAFVLGANDGLVTVASLMLGVGGGTESLQSVVLSGIAGLVGGSLSMACGEFVSVSSQRDAEEADIRTEMEQQMKGPHEFQELMQIYIDRGLSPSLAYQVATQLSEKDPVRAHARDELGIDMDNLANPWQASLASALAFSTGGSIPLLAGSFINDADVRSIAVGSAATAGLVLFGLLGAWLGGARKVRGAVRVLVGGLLAMVVTYLVGRLFGVEAA